MLISKCEVCEKCEASGLLSNLGIKTPLCIILLADPLLC